MMTPDEAQQQIDRLAELFNDATAEKCVLLHSKFQALAPDVVRAGITHYAEINKFLDVAGVLAAINTEVELRKPPTPRPVAKPMSRDEYSAYLANQEVRKREQWKPVEEAIAKLPDEELARHAAAVLPTLPDKLRHAAEKKGPRHSATLKALIYERIKTPTGA